MFDSVSNFIINKRCKKKGSCLLLKSQIFSTLQGTYSTVITHTLVKISTLTEIWEIFRYEYILYMIFISKFKVIVNLNKS